MENIPIRRIDESAEKNDSKRQDVRINNGNPVWMNGA